jgi:hypothetical protein
MKTEGPTKERDPQNWIIPSDKWKDARDRIVRKARRGLHVMEVNPGPEFKLRYDYIATAAEIAVLVEDVMLETERLCRFYLTEKR